LAQMNTISHSELILSAAPALIEYFIRFDNSFDLDHMYVAASI
jgi:hypothetical protein